MAPRRLHKFWHITIPSMKAVFTITVMLSTVFTSTSIVVVNILTNGAPANLTQILPNESYGVAIEAGRMGLGSAINMVLFPFLVVFIIFLTRRMLRKDGTVSSWPCPKSKSRRLIARHLAAWCCSS